MPPAPVTRSSIRVGRVGFTFHRTLRIPDDGTVYPLPPSLGAFPVRRVRDFERRVPASWRERGGYFIPLYQREAMWISFDGAYWRPNAVTIGVGGVNAVSGTRWTGRLSARPQNYVVVPSQPWLDGINAGSGVIRQFVAMPLGAGYTVEGQITGTETEGGLQLGVVQPKPGRFPTREPRRGRGIWGGEVMYCAEPSLEMGLGAGGRMTQRIYPDEYGIETWNTSRVRTVHVHIVNSRMYERITGEAPPPSPVSARTYTQHGLPWFALYDEHKGDVAPPSSLAGVKSIGELDGGARISSRFDEHSVQVPPWQVLSIGGEDSSIG